ncbi:MAG: ABC transporter permease, partial [Bacteroidota bacterium]|nr:ABC transporter permease [Bacteroidota bacterium]
MFKNFFIIAVRNLKRNKIFSVINIAGLAIGMASAILIGLWIQDELNFDQFHTKKDRLYMAYRLENNQGKSQAMNYTAKALAPTLKKDYPEIEDVARWQRVNFLFTVGDRHFNVPGNFTDSGFLRMFSFPLLEGNPNIALSGPTDIVITESLAKKLFGKESAFGRKVKVDSVDLFTVKGILKDLPDNTQFQFDYLLPWSYQKKIGWDDNYWENNSCLTFYTLKPGISGHDFDAKVRDIIIQHTKQDKTPSADILFGHPADKWHLYSKFENGKIAGGQIDTVRLFIIIAGFILLIACINFMNLSTARSEKRMKEVGIRKVVGALRNVLVWQFLAESLLFSFIAGLFALLIVQLSLGSFNQLVNKKLSIDFSSINFWIAGGCFILLTGLLAGSYPAFYLSSFQPIRVLKGVFKSGKEGSVQRKCLVVLQFSFAIILIISTMVVKQQIQYGQNRDSGYVKDNLVYNYMQGDAGKNYPMIRDELLSAGVAISVTRTSGPMTRHWADSWGFEWQGSTAADRNVDFNFFSSDVHFVQTMGLKLLSGRDIDASTYLTDSNALLLNEAAVKTMRLKDPVGQIIRVNGSGWHVVGVIKDFILESPYSPIAPMIIAGPNALSFYILNMKLNPANAVSDNLKKAEAIFKKYNPDYPFEYNFVDEEYASKFANEKRTGELAALFAGLTIFISCLGLFGLASFMAENRIREIGIRKVLGASVAGITQLLSKDFLKLVTISFIIASPIAWWIMNEWLQSYSYRNQ